MIKKIYQALLILLCLLLSSALTAQTITINEVMFDPVGADYYDEYIEIVNTGEAPVDLAGLYLKINDSVNSLAFIDSASVLGPGEYGLVLDRGYLIENLSTTYDSLIPIGILLCTIQDDAFGKNGPPNTEAARMLLLNPAGDTLSTMVTNPDRGAGYSEEKIDVFGNNEPANWGNATTLYGMPGYENSIAMKDFDLAIEEFDLRDSNLRLLPGSTVEFFIKIKNLGRETISNAEIQFGDDLNRDTVLQYYEVVFVENVTLSPGDSVVLYPSLVDVKSGKHTLLGVIKTEDDNPDNNLKTKPIKVSYPRGSIVINEFMYAPKTNFGGEWIELLNISEDTVNLANWQIGDNSSRVEISATDIMVPPNEFVLLSSTESITNYWEINGIYVHCEKSLPTLNNTEDSIVVGDLCGKVIDSLKYSSSWGNRQGVSLERIDPNRDSNVSDNWVLSQNPSGGTPGYMNSQMVKTYDLSVDTIYVASEDLIHNESVEFEYFVGNNGLADIGVYTIYLGVRPATVISNGTTILDTLLYYDAIIQSRSRQKKSFVVESIPGGIYQVYCEVFFSGDEKPSNDQDSCIFIVGYPENSVIVNEVMNIPESGESEWFELYNTTDMDINLNRWRFRDAGGGWRTLTTETEIITTHGFCVVAAKQDFRQAYPQFSGSLIVPDS
ncbi:MAG: lamin tail domain-containing protein, partial [Candidatus Marinimicrobia bacterium]|nr:lamin tail domain-containing protein [Candidatus Neomarinimicrobiota bacterium]